MTHPTVPNAVAELVGVRDASARIGASTQVVSSLALAGVVAAFRAGGKLFTDRAGLEKLGAAAVCVPGAAALVARVGPAAAVVGDPTRSWAGWTELAPSAERRRGVDRWWRHVPSSAVGWAFVVTVGGFIVDAGTITGVAKDGPDPDRSRMVIDWSQSQGYVVGTWLRTGPGAPLVRVGGQSTQD